MTKHQQYQKNYRLKHKFYFSKYLNNYIKQKKQSDLNYKLKLVVTSRIKRAIGKNKINIAHIDLLGCPIEQYKIYIESKFKPGMNWDNHGHWHIDHKIPCSCFDLFDENQLRICFNWKNTQPMWGKDNLSKHNKLI